ncbi:MAG: hypothetical protein KDA41_08050, partial [Planctomycetales bacterium]|nr:hypothetical protein [Planctomycetales bacterium]
MATGAISPQPSPPPVQAPAHTSIPAASYAQFVEEQLRRTRAQVKLVDIATNSLLLLAAALAYLLLVALVDHWLLPLGFWLRLGALLVLVGGCGWWFAAQILPLILRRINPVYAAYTIERSQPSLKNSLINFLLLRTHRENVHDVVFQALQQRAAVDLTHVPADSAVDHSRLIKVGYLLTGLLALGALYAVLSPRSPLQSAMRVVAPWADIDRPTSVVIEEVQPGDANIFQGEFVDVAAVVRGARSHDEVQLVYSSLDGQIVDRTVAMQLDEAGLRYVARIPDDQRGAQASLQYRIVARDAQTRWHNVEVVPAPHI